MPDAAAASPPAPERDATALARQAADLQAENRMLRGQLATLDHEREQAGLVARTLEQFSRALPAPAADAAPAPSTMVAASVRADGPPLSRRGPSVARPGDTGDAGPPAPYAQPIAAPCRALSRRAIVPAVRTSVGGVRLRPASGSRTAHHGTHGRRIQTTWTGR